MTYNVFGGTLNLAQSINQSIENLVELKPMLKQLLNNFDLDLMEFGL